MDKKKALVWSAIWIGAALFFNGLVYFFLGAEKALEFLMGYLLEKSLSVDNLLFFLGAFSLFTISIKDQRTVLNYGIIGALFFRFILIICGISFFKTFHFLTYVIGVFLFITGLQMFKSDTKQISNASFQKNFAVRLVQKFFPFTDQNEGGKFFIKKGGVYYVTPLFLVLLFVEFTDIVFALDSVPAILGITQDPFIVYTSNVFAILGLRSLYFILAGALENVKWLKKVLGALLILLGTKMALKPLYAISNVQVLLFTAFFASLAWLYTFSKSRNKL